MADRFYNRQALRRHTDPLTDPRQVQPVSTHKGHTPHHWKSSASPVRRLDVQEAALSRVPNPATLPRQCSEQLGVINDVDEVSGGLRAQYRCGALLGTGGFAKVYDFVDLQTGAVSAAKVVEKVRLKSQKKIEKLQTEIAIHRQLRHRHVLQIHRAFQDTQRYYILLEKCSNQTLLELSKSRVVLSFAEVQYLMLQLLCAVEYLHAANIIHRDLKLANILVDSQLQLKVGDFGLAASCAYRDEKKRTMCGTPNYLAPEVLAASRSPSGYDFRADIWSLGVILFTLFVGSPPFETRDLKTTYQLIQNGQYMIPSHVPAAARSLIQRILRVDPGERPSLVEIRRDPFFHGLVSSSTPPLALVEYYAALHHTTVEDYRATYLTDTPLVAEETPPPLAARTISPSPVHDDDQGRSPTARNYPPPPPAARRLFEDPLSPPRGGGGDYLQSLLQRLDLCEWEGRHGMLPPLRCHNDKSPLFVTDLAMFPRYGVGYRTNTGHHGALFNDKTKLVWEPLTGTAEYYQRVRCGDPLAAGQAPVATDSGRKLNVESSSDAVAFEQSKKVTLGKYFRSFLAQRHSAVSEVLMDAVGAGHIVQADQATDQNPVTDLEAVERVHAVASGPSVMCCVPGAVVFGALAETHPSDRSPSPPADVGAATPHAHIIGLPALDVLVHPAPPAHEMVYVKQVTTTEFTDQGGDSRSAVVLRLSNGDVQVTFFAKLPQASSTILCAPLVVAVAVVLIQCDMTVSVIAWPPGESQCPPRFITAPAAALAAATTNTDVQVVCMSSVLASGVSLSEAAIGGARLLPQDAAHRNEDLVLAASWIRISRDALTAATQRRS